MVLVLAAEPTLGSETSYSISNFCLRRTSSRILFEALTIPVDFDNLEGEYLIDIPSRTKNSRSLLLLK